MPPKVILKKGHQKSLERFHPWIFSGAIAKEDRNIQNGDTVDVIAPDGLFLARGAYSGDSKIRVRVWSWDSREIIDQNFFKARILKSFAARKALIGSGKTNALRQV